MSTSHHFQLTPNYAKLNVKQERKKTMSIKVHFNHHYGYGENEKDVEVVEFPEGTTDKEIQQEFENFVWEKIGDDFYWNKTKLETRKEENNE